jgi:hypothetical protein
MHLFRDSCVSTMLKSSCIGTYTAVLRVALSCSHKKSTRFVAPLNELLITNNQRVKNMKTKYFNMVTNSQHGACLLFDRKGLGMHQSRTPRAEFFSMRKNISTSAFNKTFLSLRSQVKNMMAAQKLLRPGQVHQWCGALSPHISFRR